MADTIAVEVAETVVVELVEMVVVEVAEMPWKATEMLALRSVGIC